MLVYGDWLHNEWKTHKWPTHSRLADKRIRKRKSAKVRILESPFENTLNSCQGHTDCKIKVQSSQSFIHTTGHCSYVTKSAMKVQPACSNCNKPLYV